MASQKYSVSDTEEQSRPECPMHKLVRQYVQVLYEQKNSDLTSREINAKIEAHVNTLLS
jgi:hypothetical protein